MDRGTHVHSKNDIVILVRSLSHKLKGHVNCTVTAVVGCAVPHDRKGCDCVVHERGVCTDVHSKRFNKDLCHIS